MKHAIAAAIGLVAAGAIGLGIWVAAQGAATADTVTRYERDSKYYHIEVVDYLREGRRCLHFSKSRGIQTSMILAEPEKLDLAYAKSMVGAFALRPEPKEVLVIGLGGAGLPKFIQKQFPDVKLDIVEIDPDVVKVCQDWFQFKGTPNTRVIVMDGRMYLKRSDKPYDIILLDAYAADRVPFHMTTTEFVQLVKSRLKADGIVATNLWEQALNRFYFAEVKTYQSVFPQTYALKSGNSGNVIVFGTLDDKLVPKAEWIRRAQKVSAKPGFGLDLGVLVAQEYSILTTLKTNEKALTDDMAPVDTLRHENPKYFEQP